MNAQRNLRYAPAGSRQRGQAALLTVLLILGVGVTAIIYSLATPAKISIENDKKTAAVLAQAKEALIGRAAADSNRPGSLPCPDINNDGSAEIFTGFPTNDCPSYIGRLPWRTLGLPDLRDGYGERLWYALSPLFRDYSGAGILNSDSEGQFDITGSTTANKVIAVVFAPGLVTGSQARGTATDQNDVANYLEGGNETGIKTNTFITNQESSAFNDKLLPITRDALMSVVEMRVLRTMRAALVAYTAATPGSGYPFASPYSDTVNYECAYLQIEGRFPVKMKTLSPLPSGCLLYSDWGPELPAWFSSNLWQTVTYYSVDPCKVASVVGAAGAIESDLNVLCALGVPPKVDGTVKDAVVLVGSRALTTVTGQTPRPCGARDACFEAPNLSGNAFVTPSRSSINNDRLTSVP